MYIFLRKVGNHDAQFYRHENFKFSVFANSVRKSLYWKRSYFGTFWLYLINGTNIAVLRTYEVGETLAPLNRMSEVLYDDRDKNM
jgi:hypothetical protein